MSTFLLVHPPFTVDAKFKKLFRFQNFETMISGNPQKTKRASNSKKRKIETEHGLTYDASQVAKAFVLVNIKSFVPDFNTLEEEEYKRELGKQIESLKATTLDKFTDTRFEFITAINSTIKPWPVPHSTARSVTFVKGNNNVNKFFGNDLGNLLRKYTTSMAKHFAGTKKYFE